MEAPFPKLSLKEPLTNSSATQTHLISDSIKIQLPAKLIIAQANRKKMKLM
jgi:hypothetical protein